MLTEISFVYNLLGFLYHLFYNEHENEDNLDTELWVANKIMEFEFTELQKQPMELVRPSTPEIPRNTTCFHRSGVITLLEYPNIMIDGQLFFDISSCAVPLNLNDKVTYLGYKNEVDQIIVTRILENHGMVWGSWDDEKADESDYKVIEHVIVAEVDFRQERLVHLKDNDLKFSLDDVEGLMVPIPGDWLELKCSVQLDDDKPYNITGSQVLKVISYRPLRTIIKSAVVTEWNGTEGNCNRQIYFDRQCLPNACDVPVGQKVLVEAIESNQGSFSWRAIKLVPTGERVAKKMIEAENCFDNSTLNIEKEMGLEITFPIKFHEIDFKQTSEIVLRITNNSKQTHIFNKWVIPSRKRDSQINVYPILMRPCKIHPSQTYSLNITCKPKFLGTAKENLVLLFKGFKVERIIEINVAQDDWLDGDRMNGNHSVSSQANKHAQMNRVRQNAHEDVVPGPRLRRPPNFVLVKLGMYPIPEKMWAAVLGDSSQVEHRTSDFNRAICQIENKLPCLTQDLNINNYTDRWHTLLFMEEINENINIRAYDQSKTFLIKLEDYLALEVSSLSERRPSLVLGDRAIVKDIWDNRPARYEGYVHAVRGDLVLMKFQRQFHESYSGSDVSIEFHFSRTVHRRQHQAINLALSNLGPEILFPTRLTSRECQLPSEKLDSIQWYNKKLNDCQKAAVSNILLGQCRPKPYLIYGPPGTGKTITVVETILQILTLLPDSRILVATPSNSSANLITERLVEYKKHISNSFTRIVAYHLLEGDKIPHHIKPYCASLETSTEGTTDVKRRVQNGIQTGCQASFIGRQRVTIGTCNTLGMLTTMGFPKGHFTHVIVDEAGQATEPGIMVPLNLTDKENGQIILAGDPMQLGPVITSMFAKDFGLGESYLCRLLDTFPYQKDFAAFKDGFNEKLVTKLNDNYRSLKQVISLPSQMFYDGSLLPKINTNQKWIQKIVTVMNKIFDSGHSDTGGFYVNGIRGENTRAQDSPSWYNRHEASTVAMTLCELYKGDITADDIGIITPYIAQVKYLRVILESLGLPVPKIGSVEEFQGQERSLIIISTVRSSSSLLEEDRRYQLGFIGDSKRLNVAVTRARVAVLMVCDPHLLCTDPLWSQIIGQAVKDDKYMGCDLPVMFDKSPK